MELKDFRVLFKKTLFEDMSHSLKEMDINDDSDLVDLGIDSMGSLLFINALEEKLNKKLDLDKLEKYEFKVSIKNLFQAFFN